MGFINPVVDSDDEDDNIFESQRTFSGPPSFSFHAFPEIPKLLGNDAYKKKSIFNTTAKLRYRKLEYFGQSTKLKCRRIQKLFKKTKTKNKREIKMPRIFFAL